jgi:hypothetical protein
MMCCFGLKWCINADGLLGVDFPGNNGRVIRKCTKDSSVISILFSGSADPSRSRRLAIRNLVAKKFSDSHIARRHLVSRALRTETLENKNKLASDRLPSPQMMPTSVATTQIRKN